jgi:hypothetical protein
VPSELRAGASAFLAAASRTAVEAPGLELETLANYQEWVRADIITRARMEILDLPHAVDVTVRYKNAIAQLNYQAQGQLIRPPLRKRFKP